jgi:hypothetical protein
MKFIITILLLLILCSFILPTVETELYGHIKSILNKGKVSGVLILVKQGDQFIAKTITDSKGNFHLNYNGSLTTPETFYYINSKRDTIMFQTPKFAEIRDQTFEATFYIP